MQKNSDVLFFFLFMFFTLGLITPISSSAKVDIEEMQARGGAQFSKCYFCHSLKPNVNLTGPSLSELWNAPAGSVKSYELYSDALRKSGLRWDESTIKKWLLDSVHVVKETTMPYKFGEDNESLKNLIEFLKVAMSTNGYETVLAKRFISKEFADGQRPKSETKVDSENMIEKIEHCKTFYTIYKKNKQISKHWIENISFRIGNSISNSVDKNIKLYTTGSLGDRFLVIFPNLEMMKEKIKPCIQK